MLDVSKRAPWRELTYRIIFEADTPAGRLFDVILIVAIAASLALVMLESVAAINRDYGAVLHTADLVITVLFTIEYILRLLSVRQPMRYALSFFGLVDLLAIVPGYLSLLFDGTQSLLVIRALRLLRVFRVFKLSHYVGEARILVTALKASRTKIFVFMFSVVLITVNMGALMYLIEGDTSG
ncbi:MAG: ion transporter, partial [Myxococcota bacterium]